MLSNNTKPRRIHRLAATAAATAGIGIALPLLAGTVAHADTSVWQRVAQCESTGNWSINTGNGFYGGLQFTESTWLAYGGGAYAQYANQASESQQIAIAQKVLASQGVHAWPVCGPRAGLTLANGSGSVTVTGSSSSSSYSTHHSTTTTHHSSSTTSTTTRESSESSTPTTVKVTSSSTGGSYTVKSGDTLSKIASAHHVAGGWEALYSLNKSVVGSNANLIFPGQHLVF